MEKKIRAALTALCEDLGQAEAIQNPTWILPTKPQGVYGNQLEKPLAKMKKFLI